MATHSVGQYKRLPFSNNCDVCGKVYFKTIIPFSAQAGGPHAPNSHLFGYQIDFICIECNEIVLEVLRELDPSAYIKATGDPEVIKEAQKR